MNNYLVILNNGDTVISDQCYILYPKWIYKRLSEQSQHYGNLLLTDRADLCRYLFIKLKRSLNTFDFIERKCKFSYFGSFRKCDVVNRGFSGYNSRWARMIMQTALPTELLKDAVAMTVFLGANDACLQEVGPCQFVGVQDYADNMKVRIKYL